MGKRPIHCLCFCCLMIMVLVSACGEEPPQPPQSYTIGTASAPPLDTLLTGEEDGELTAITSLDETDPENTDQEADAQESPAPGGGMSYTYEKLPQGGETVHAYVELLTGEERFMVVDETGQESAEPDYAKESGTVFLAKNTQEDSRFQITLEWKSTSCTVSVTEEAGGVKRKSGTGMDLEEAVTFFKSIPPALLGLEGESMEEYNVYPLEGVVLVDGEPCLELNVFARSPEGTNDSMGIYMLSSDKAHLYCLDDPTDKGSIREIELYK